MRSSRAGIYERNIFPNNRGAQRSNEQQTPRPGPANSYLMDAIYLAFGKFYCALLCASTGYAKCGRRTSTPLNLRRGLCIHQISCLTFLYMPARIPQRIFREPCCGQLNELSSRAWMCQICNKNKCFLPKTTAAAPIHYLPWFSSEFADTCSALDIRVVRLWFMIMSEK